MIWRALLAAVVLVAQPAIADELTLDTKRSLVDLERELEMLPSPTGLESVALGSVIFLRSVEAALQERYRVNASFGDFMIGIPILRLPVSPNPDPEPFEPEFVASLFARVDAEMDRVRAALAAVKLDSDDKLVIDVAGLWFDINGDGSRSFGEGVLEFVAVTLEGGLPGALVKIPSEGLIVHFDAADVEWLAAYTHLLSAVSELVLAFDPTDVIADIMASNAAMDEVQGSVPPSPYNWFAGMENIVDPIATLYGALNRVPEADRIGAARDHFFGMIDRNRAFWNLVDDETDNSLEWIPNASQEAALGFSLPADTGAVWQDVLADAKAVLKGELLVPHWRTEPGGGVNVAVLMADPPAFDIVTWFQGAGLVPYMEKGPLVTFESFARFNRMFLGDAILYMVLLN